MCNLVGGDEMDVRKCTIDSSRIKNQSRRCLEPRAKCQRLTDQKVSRESYKELIWFEHSASEVMMTVQSILRGMGKS